MAALIFVLLLYFISLFWLPILAGCLLGLFIIPRLESAKQAQSGNPGTPTPRAFWVIATVITTLGPRAR